MDDILDLFDQILRLPPPDESIDQNDGPPGYSDEALALR